LKFVEESLRERKRCESQLWLWRAHAKCIYTTKVECNVLYTRFVAWNCSNLFLLLYNCYISDV